MRLIWIAGAITLGLAPIGILGCQMKVTPPTNLDYGWVRTSESGALRASIKPDGDSIPQKKLQQWTLHLETISGVPVDSIDVTVDGGMPQHGHGLPTQPLVTKHLGNGDHLVEGMKFSMSGWWIVKFRLNSAAGRDSVVFNLKL